MDTLQDYMIMCCSNLAQILLKHNDQGTPRSHLPCKLTTGKTGTPSYHSRHRYIELRQPYKHVSLFVSPPETNENIRKLRLNK